MFMDVIIVQGVPTVDENYGSSCVVVSGDRKSLV